MSANVFPQEEVGTFFNKNFISVQVQMDKTTGDKEEIKKWYGEAKMISDQYAVKAFPTFLYFSPEGKLINREIGSVDAKSFLAKSAIALAKQYVTLLENFRKKSVKTTAEIRDMAIIANENNDPKYAGIFKSQYLATQKDLYTKENLEFITAFTQSSKDKEFEIFLKNGAQIDKVLGIGTAIQKVNSIILKEEVVPRLPKDPGAGAPDWNAINLFVKKKYPAFADEVILYAEVLYCPFMQDWVGFQQAIVLYMKKYGRTVMPTELNNFAWIILKHGTDMKCIEKALEWSKRSFQDKENPNFMNTYANLLFKLGKKQEAINGNKRLSHLQVEIRNSRKHWIK